MKDKFFEWYGENSGLFWGIIIGLLVAILFQMCIRDRDNQGTYIMNSRDLMMIEHIPELAEAGITSFKIEGRMKSAYYVASVVHAYRRAIDKYESDPQGYRFDKSLKDELVKSASRGLSLIHI